MEDTRNSLTDVLECAKILAQENPCHMPKFTMDALANGLRMMMHKDYQTGMSQEDVRKYYGVDSVRTIQRWATKYDDFPQLKKIPGKQACYDAMEVIKWKQVHLK